MEMLIWTKERRARRVIAAPHATETITVGIAGSCNVGPSMFSSLKLCVLHAKRLFKYSFVLWTRDGFVMSESLHTDTLGSTLVMFHHVNREK